jgi:hypothetical protein
MVLQEVMKMIQSVALVSGMMVVALVGYRGSVDREGAFCSEVRIDSCSCLFSAAGVGGLQLTLTWDVPAICTAPEHGCQETGDGCSYTARIDWVPPPGCNPTLMLTDENGNVILLGPPPARVSNGNLKCGSGLTLNGWCNGNIVAFLDFGCNNCQPH